MNWKIKAIASLLPCFFIFLIITSNSRCDLIQGFGVNAEQLFFFLLFFSLYFFTVVLGALFWRLAKIFKQLDLSVSRVAFYITLIKRYENVVLGQG